MLLVTDLQRGGSPLRIARLARGLTARGLQVHAGCLAPRGPVSVELEAAGIPTFSCEARGSWDVRALSHLRRHVERFEPALLHATLTHANLAARAVAGWCALPVIGSTATIERERRWHLLAERASAWMDAAHVVGSAAVAAHVARCFRVSPERIHVVAPPIDPPSRFPRSESRRRLGIPEGGFLWAWAGRMDPVKRVGLLLAAIRELREARLLLVGDGDQRPELVARVAADARLSGRVHFSGWQADLGVAFSAADAFVLPSLTEGAPNALLEAMAFGLPCVASDIDVHRELAGSDGGEALRLRLVQLPECSVLPDDAITDLARAMTDIQQHAGEAQRLALAARAWAREHTSPEAAVKQLIRVYERVLGAG